MFRDQIEIIETLGTKLTYSVKVRDQIHNLPKKSNKQKSKEFMKKLLNPWT